VLSGGSNYQLTPSATNASNNDGNNDSAGSTCIFTPKSAGTYRIRVTLSGKSYITGETVTRAAETDVVCYSSPLAKTTVFTSPLRNYSPGQFTEAGSGYGWSLGTFDGYVDTDETYGKWHSNPYWNSYAVSDAAYADGSPVTLTNVCFIKVQTAAFRYAGIFGEISTEINSAGGLGLLPFLPKPPREK
jgi:hypothetical protein